VDVRDADGLHERAVGRHADLNAVLGEGQHVWVEVGEVSWLRVPNYLCRVVGRVVMESYQVTCHWNHTHTNIINAQYIL